MCKYTYKMSENYQIGLKLYNEKQFDKAFEYFQLASDQDLKEAQCSLGFMYKNGYGVEKSYQKAIEYYQLATDQGLKEAQNKPEVREKHSIRMKTKNPMNNQDTLQKMIQTVNKPEIKKKKSLSQPNRIVVEQYTLANIFVAKYHSLNEAVRSLGLKHHSGIGNCLSGKNKTAHGFKWKSVN